MSSYQNKALTPCELQVLILLRQGLTTQAIAKALDRSVNTIAVHRAHILKKMGVHTTAQALQAATDDKCRDQPTNEAAPFIVS